MVEVGIVLPWLDSTFFRRYRPCSKFSFSNYRADRVKAMTTGLNGTPSTRESTPVDVETVRDSGLRKLSCPRFFGIVSN